MKHMINVRSQQALMKLILLLLNPQLLTDVFSLHGILSDKVFFLHMLRTHSGQIRFRN
jgi:hypothetical protein